jgi:hypothetical protein
MTEFERKTLVRCLWFLYGIMAVVVLFGKDAVVLILKGVFS